MCKQNTEFHSNREIKSQGNFMYNMNFSATIFMKVKLNKRL